MTAVFDSSALLALLWSEPGSEKVAAVLEGAIMSAVNLAEVCAKLSDRGIAGEEAKQLLLDLPIRIVAFDDAQALRTAALRAPTRRHGLSIGDRACLGLAIAEDGMAVTADRAWVGLDLDVKILSIR